MKNKKQISFQPFLKASEIYSSRKRPFTGFTLVEIMVVVGVIALLAAIATPNLLRAKINANETTAQATLKTIATAMENYFTVNSSYPTLPADLYSAVPPYLGTDFFAATYQGFDYISILTTGSYTVHAVPTGPNQGTVSFTLTTGGVIQKN